VLRLYRCNNAGALDATDLEIWTDVNGMYTANPKIVKQASHLYILSGAMELSHFGAKSCSSHYSARPEKKHSYS
jgi:aspartokinase